MNMLEFSIFVLFSSQISWTFSVLNWLEALDIWGRGDSSLLLEIISSLASEVSEMYLFFSCLSGSFLKTVLTSSFSSKCSSRLALGRSSLILYSFPAQSHSFQWHYLHSTIVILTFIFLAWTFLLDSRSIFLNWLTDRYSCMSQRHLKLNTTKTELVTPNPSQHHLPNLPVRTQTTPMISFPPCFLW